MSKNALRTCYELATNVFESRVRGRNFEQFKTLAPNSRLTYELQEVTTNYKIKLRTSRIDYDSATIPKIYRFVAIRGGSGRSGIPHIREPQQNYRLGRSVINYWGLKHVLRHQLPLSYMAAYERISLLEL